MEPMRHVTMGVPPNPLLELVGREPVKPVQTRAVRDARRRHWRHVLASIAACLLIAVPMALHVFWGVTGSAVLTDVTGLSTKHIVSFNGERDLGGEREARRGAGLPLDRP